MERRSKTRNGFGRLAAAALILLGAAAPALAHGVYAAQAGDYEVVLHLARPNETAMPMDVMAGEEVEIAFFIQNRATGEELSRPGPAVEVVHTMGSMRHAMRVEARPPEPP